MEFLSHTGKYTHARSCSLCQRRKITRMQKLRIKPRFIDYFLSYLNLLALGWVPADILCIWFFFGNLASEVHPVLSLISISRFAPVPELIKFILQLRLSHSKMFCALLKFLLFHEDKGNAAKLRYIPHLSASYSGLSRVGSKQMQTFYPSVRTALRI